MCPGISLVLLRDKRFDWRIGKLWENRRRQSISTMFYSDAVYLRYLARNQINFFKSYALKVNPGA